MPGKKKGNSGSMRNVMKGVKKMLGTDRRGGGPHKLTGPYGGIRMRGGGVFNRNPLKVYQ
jgi:hypothetical protein